MASKEEKTIVLTNSLKERVEIAPWAGGAIKNVFLKKNNYFHNIISCDSNKNFLNIYTKYYNQAKLLPFANRINNGTFEFLGKKYELKKNDPLGHAIHGFIFDKKFSIASLHTTHVTLYYEYTGNDEGYPFPFLVVLTYRLMHGGVECITEIKNLSNQQIPISDGWHPYFTTFTYVDNLELQIPSNKVLEINNKMIPTSNFLDFDKFQSLEKIDSYCFDSCFVVNNEPIAKTILKDNYKDLKIIIWQETGLKKYNYLQIFTPPDRLSIAIEPMTSAPDAFNNGLDLILLDPSEKITLCFGFYIE